MITVHEVEQGSEEWKALRDGKYTGTSAEKVLRFGAIPYSLTSSSNFRGNYWTKRGHILEQEAIELYEAINGVTISRPGFVTNSLYPGCGYSPDGLLPKILIEIKCFDVKEHMKLINAKSPHDVPVKIRAQIYFGMVITGLRCAHLIAYNPTLPAELAYRVITLHAEPAITANFRAILRPRLAVA